MKKIISLLVLSFLVIALVPVLTVFSVQEAFFSEDFEGYAIGNGQSNLSNWTSQTSICDIIADPRTGASGKVMQVRGANVILKKGGLDFTQDFEFSFELYQKRIDTTTKTGAFQKIFVIPAGDTPAANRWNEFLYIPVGPANAAAGSSEYALCGYKTTGVKLMTASDNTDPSQWHKFKIVGNQLGTAQGYLSLYIDGNLVYGPITDAGASLNSGTLLKRSGYQNAELQLNLSAWVDDGTGGLLLDNIKVTKNIPFEATLTNADRANVYSLDFTSNFEFSDTALSDTQIQVFDMDGVQVQNSSIVKDAMDTKKLHLTFLTPLSFQTQYLLKFNNAILKNGEGYNGQMNFTTRNRQFFQKMFTYKNTGTETDVLDGGSISIAAQYQNEFTAVQDYHIITAYYQGAKLMEVKETSGTAQPGETVDISSQPISVMLPDDSSNCYMKTFIWSEGNKTQPLSVAQAIYSGNFHYVLNKPAVISSKNINLAVNYEQTQFEISGTLGLGDANKTVLAIAKDSTGKLIYIEEIDTDPTGKYGFIVKPEYSDVYQIVVSGLSTNDLSQSVKYYLSEEVAAALAAIQAAKTESDFVQLLAGQGRDTELLAKLGIDDLSFISLLHKSLVYKTLAGMPEFHTSSEFANYFNLAVAVGAALDEKDGTNAKGLINDYKTSIDRMANASLKLDENLFGLFSTALPKTVLEILSRANADVDSIYTFKASFEQEVFLNALSTTEFDAQTESLLGLYNQALNIGLDLTYGGLNDEGKTIVNKALTGQYYDSLQALKTAFDSALSAEKKRQADLADKKTNHPTASNPISVSSGGGGYTSYTAVALTDEEMEKATTTSFQDMSSAEWAKAAVFALEKKGIVKGMEDGLFMPDSKVTREQFVKLIVEGFSIEKADKAVAFLDVDSQAWYYEYIAAALSAGLIQGKDETYFGIGEPITREDMAVISSRALELKGMKLNNNSDTQIEDIEQASEYSKAIIKALKEKSIMNGDADGLFFPKNNATRAEAVQLIYNMLVKLNLI